MPNINGRICENNFRDKSVLDQRPQRQQPQQQQRPSNLSPTHQAFFEAFPSRNSSDSIQTSNSLYYNNENFVHQKALPLTPSKINEHKKDYQSHHHPSQQRVYRNPSTKSSHYINENYYVNDGPLSTTHPALMYQRQKSAQSQYPPSFTPEYNKLQTNTLHFYDENSFVQEGQFPSTQYEKQRENYGYQNIQQLLPSQISYRNPLPFEDNAILKKPPLPLKPQKYQNFEQPKNQQKLLQREFNNFHPIENEIFHQQRYHSLKYKIEKYEYENQQQQIPSYSSVHNNPKKHVSSSANFKTTSNGYRNPSESINNYLNGIPNSNKTNEPQIQQNNYNNFPTPTVYYSTEPQTLIPSKNTLNVPPKPPPRISSLKDSIVQKQNPPDFYNNIKINQNSTEKPFFHNSTTFNKSPENGQKKLEKAIISNYFSDSADSGFNDAFATPTKEYNSPSQNSNDSIKTLAVAASNSDDQKEKEDEEKPAFHKYFKVNPSPSIKEPFHSSARGKNNNRFRERNVHPIFGFQNLSGVSRIGGFSSTVNDHLKFNPSPKNDNKYQQLDDNSKINIAPEAQKNSSAEKNSAQNGKTIVEGGFEVAVSDGKILPKFENWKEMNLNQKLLENIQESNFQQPLNIHKSVIPYIQNRYNVKYESDGTEKTGTYIIPLIDNLIKDKESQKFSNNVPICLIISPTRESTHQIYEQVLKFANGTGITVGYCYGENNNNNTSQNLSKLRNFGCNILCACIGRLMNFVESGNISLDSIKYLVIKEAEKFIGSKFDMENGILKLLNYPLLPSKENRQTILFSATLRDPVVSKFADKNVHSKKQVIISIKCQLPNVTNIQAKDSASFIQ